MVDFLDAAVFRQLADLSGATGLSRDVAAAPAPRHLQVYYSLKNRTGGWKKMDSVVRLL